jgi:hypothetical protein
MTTLFPTYSSDSFPYEKNIPEILNNNSPPLGFRGWSSAQKFGFRG